MEIMWKILLLAICLTFLSGVLAGGSIRVNEIMDLDPQQAESQSIGILNTIFTDNVGPTTTRGLLIDAGSGGSRVHVYEWSPRVFKQVPPPISFPTTNELYTGRISDGVQLCWRENQSEEDLMENLEAHLAPLIDFAKESLKGMEDQFSTIPIWFKATGGARELPASARLDLVNGIRKLLIDDSFCPFYFHHSMARVISGEEEAVFSWACMNFLFGNLIPESEGLGSATGGGNLTTSYGTIDLGGSSTQIAFYLPSEDLMEGLYKLQIGGQKHWNIYAKSFLKFGLNSARRRHFQYLAALAIAEAGGVKQLLSKGAGKKNEDEIEDCVKSLTLEEAKEKLSLLPADGTPLNVENPCFPVGYSETAHNLPEFSIDLHMTAPAAAHDHSTEDSTYDINKRPNKANLKACRKVLLPLMDKSSNSYCDDAYHGDCSIGGQYQPALPMQQHFMGTSTYKVPWGIMRLPQNATISMIRERAATVCDMNYAQLKKYVEDYQIKTDKSGPEHFCFDVAYTMVLLEDGYGFSDNMTVTVLDTVNGYKVGWPLGAILHELNNLPWELEDPFDRSPWGTYVLVCLGGVIIGAVIAFSISKELNFDDSTITTTNANTNNNHGGTRSNFGSLPTGGRGRTETGTIQMTPLMKPAGSGGGTTHGASDKSSSSPSGESNTSSPGANWQEKISQYVPIFPQSASKGSVKSNGSYESLDTTEHRDP